MITTITAQQLQALDSTIRQTAARTNDPQIVLTSCRQSHPDFFEDLPLARALEMIAQSALARGDSQFAHYVAYLACAALPSPFCTIDSQTASLLARLTGDYKAVFSSLVPLPDHARWLVSGESDLPIAASTIELISKNLHAHFERLDCELKERVTWIFEQSEADGDDLSGAKKTFLESYRHNGLATRASLIVVIQSLLAMGGATLAQDCARLLSALDDALLPMLFERLDESAGLLCVESVSLETLNQSMQCAFERAWRLGDPESRSAFERSIRARYAREVQLLDSHDARERALENYVEQSLAQLARGGSSLPPASRP